MTKNVAIMILRLLFCVYFVQIGQAIEWQPFSDIPGTTRPLEMPKTIANPLLNVKHNVAYHTNSFMDNNIEVSSKPTPLLEIKSQNERCYSLEAMMKMLQGILTYLHENPNKINYLHHLISFLNEDDNNKLNKFSEVFNIIERDESLPHQEKEVLRELLSVEERKPDMKTSIVFKHEMPSLNEPQCKNVFMKLVEVAHDAYMQLAKYPTCQSKFDGNYDKSNNEQPRIPKGPIDFPNQFPDNIKPNDIYKPNLPDNSNNDDLIKIQSLIDSLKKDSGNHKTDNINDDLQNILIGFSKNPNQEKPNDYLPFVYPDVKPNFNDNNYVPNPFNIFETTTKMVIDDNRDYTFNYIPYVTKPNGENQNNYDNSLQKPEIIEKIISLMKPLGQNAANSQIMTLIQLLRNTNPGHTNPKLTEIILSLLVRNKNVPDLKIIQIITPLLKPNMHGEVNPKIIELILNFLKLNKDEVSNEKYQTLFSLLSPGANGEVNPKLIEIISSLLNINENSPPNNKITQILVTFLNLNDRLNPRNIDILLNLLKLNNNHRIPEQLYQKIIQYLIKLNNEERTSNLNNNNFYYPAQYPNKWPNTDESLQALLLTKYPHLLPKLVPNSPYPAVPNQINPNMAGIIELTYLLKHPKPFVYQPFYYVKYRLPLPTFMANVKNLLQKDPLLTANPTKLYTDLITISNVTEISPNLKGFSKDDILKLTLDHGALVKTKVTDDNNMNFKEQIKLLQDLNSDVRPESLLEQSRHILSGQDTTQKMDQFWQAMRPETREPNLNLKLSDFNRQPIPVI